jgi:pyruvate dehydrogenase E2 component (dihydrolipoamide acetyltransferase)
MTSSLAAITMPKWGLTMTEGKVVRWSKEQGAEFAPGDELLEIETSKITNVVEAETSGTLARIVAPEGSTLPIGALLAVVAPADAPAAEIDAFVSGFVVVEPSSEDTTEQAAAMETRELDIAGKRLRYLEVGSPAGVPMVFLHGFGADLNSWMFNQPALAEDRRTIAFDLPGHGGSTKEVGAGDLASLVAVVETAVTTLGIERMHLTGHSMGGALAATLAARRPERVATLTLIAPAGFGPEISVSFIEGFVRAARRKDTGDVLHMLVHDPSLVSRTMVEDVLRYKRLDGVTAALETIARAWFPGGRQGVSIIADVTALDLPVQVIWGRDDRIIPAQHADAVAARVQVHVLDHTGHLPHMEKAGEVNRLMRQIAGRT